MIEPELADARLARATQALYAAFAHHPRPTAISYCDHCVIAEENEILLTVPLLELTGDQLERYAWKVTTTWGSDADFRYFLPRILELLFAGDIWSAETIVRRVVLFGSHWSESERAAITEMLDAWWWNTLARYPAPQSAADVLESLEVTGGDPRRYLAQWEGPATDAGIRHLADFVLGRAMSVQLDDEWPSRVREWMESGVPARILEAAAADPQMTVDVASAFEYADYVRREANA